MKAYIFARPSGADILGFVYGHVAFGFETAAGNATCGGVEVADGKTSCVNNAMDFWQRQTSDPLTFMSSQVPYGVETRYDMCKILDVAAPNPAAAMSQIDRIEGVDYNLLSQNCRTDVVEVLQAYGVTGLPGGARPAGFFGGIDAPITPLVVSWPGLDLDFSIYGGPDQFGLRDDPEPNQQGYVADPTADVSPNGPDWPTVRYGAFLLRKGFLALFPENYFAGEVVEVPVGKVINVRNLPWADTTVRSWYASTVVFDAAQLAAKADANQIDSRFDTAYQRRVHIAGLSKPPHFSLQDQHIAAKA